MRGVGKAVDQDTAPVPQDEPDSGDLLLSDAQHAYRESRQFLTPAAQAFAEHWAYHRNQTKAYLHAYPGSSNNAARRESRRLFADPRIQAEIRRVFERWTDHSVVKLLDLEHELSRLGRSDVRLLFDERGNVRPPHEWDADTAAAVSSYQEEERWEGRGEDRTKVITRKVRLAEKHGPLRTLMEAKGAFERNKTPPGIQASFTINLGAGPQALGGQGQSFTVDVGGSSAVPKAKRVPKLKALPKEIDSATEPTPKTPPVVAKKIGKRKKPKKAGIQAERARRRAVQAAGSRSAMAATRQKAATQPPDDGKTPASAVFQPSDELDHIYNGAIERTIEPAGQDAGDQAAPPAPTRRANLFGDKA